MQRCRMDLGDGGRGERFGIKRGKYLVDGFAKGFFDDLACFFAWKRRNPVLQQCQFIGDIQGQQIPAGRQYLPKLHLDRAKFLQRQAQTFTSWQAGHILSGRDENPHPANGKRQAGGAEQFIQAVLLEDDTDMPDPQELAQAMYHEYDVP